MFLKEELDEQDGRISTCMPAITRWGSHLTTFKTVRKYKENSSISNVYNIWSDLERTFNPNPALLSIIPLPVRKFVTQQLHDCWKLIYDPIFYAAYAIDPRFRQNGCLDQRVYDTAEEIIKKISSQNIVNEFIKFRRGLAPYNHQIAEDESPCQYWSRFACVTTTEGLAKVALKILGFPQSAASVERTFSAIRRIHTWQRSCIGREKLAKLVFIYVNRRALQKQLNAGV